MNAEKRVERFFLGLAGLVLVLLSYLLYDDTLLFPDSDVLDREPIGKVSFSERDVRLKGIQSFAWIAAQADTIVRNRDSIFTGANSSATVTLQNGSRIHVRPNSLIVFDQRTGQMTLNLRYGDVEGNGSGLRLVAGSQVVDLSKDSAVEVQRSRTGKVDMRVREGEVTLNGGQKLNASHRPEPPPAVLLNGGATARFPRLRPEENPSLKWESRGTMDSFVVELCEGPACRSPIRSWFSTEPLAELPAPAPDGALVWRVRGQRGGRTVATSPVQTLHVVTVPPPMPLAPFGPSAHITKGNAGDKNNRAAIDLQWSSSPDIAAYEVEIQNDSTGVEIRRRTPDDHWQTDPLGDGTYSWKVRGILTDGRATDWGDQASLVVALVSEPRNLPRPILKELLVEFQPTARDPRQPASPTAPAPELSWAPVTGADNYQVELAAGPDFRDARRFQVKDGQWRWTAYHPGDWYARVTAVNQQGLRSPASEIARIHVEFPKAGAPTVASVVTTGHRVDQAPPKAAFNPAWPAVAQARSYILQVSSTPDFARPATTSTTKTEARVHVKRPGAYHFRVRPVFDGGATGDFSPVATARYDFVITGPPPVLLEPFDKASVFIQSTSLSQIWLEWKPLPSAESYHVQVATDPKFTRLVVDSQVNGRRYLVQKKLAKGSLYWRVRGVTRITREPSAWSSPQSFLVHSEGLPGANE